MGRKLLFPLNTKLRGNIVEIWGEFNLAGNGFYEVRLIGFRFPKTKEYRWYATNFTSSVLLAEWIFNTWRTTSWEILST